MPASLCMGQGIIIQLRTSATLSLPLTCLSFPPCPCPGNSRHKASNLDALRVWVCKAPAFLCRGEGRAQELRPSGGHLCVGADWAPYLPM